MSSIAPQNTRNSFHGAAPETTQTSFATLIPPELIAYIFSYLELNTLAVTRNVCTKQKDITDTYHLQKNFIYKEFAFGYDKWAQCFGADSVKNEDKKEEFASLLWKEFVTDSKNFKNIFSGKEAKDCLMLV